MQSYLMFTFTPLLSVPTTLKLTQSVNSWRKVQKSFRLCAPQICISRLRNRPQKCNRYHTRDEFEAKLRRKSNYHFAFGASRENAVIVWQHWRSAARSMLSGSTKRLHDRNNPEARFTCLRVSCSTPKVCVIVQRSDKGAARRWPDDIIAARLTNAR
jgi:hypothetical protein